MTKIHDDVIITSKIPDRSGLVFANLDSDSPTHNSGISFSPLSVNDIGEVVIGTTQVMRVPLTGQNNLNQNTSGTTVRLNNPNINTVIGGSVISNAISLPEGIYSVSVSISNTANAGIRHNLGLRIRVNGSTYSERWGSNYIRRTSGHNESGDCFNDLVQLNAAGSISLQMFRQAGTGTVTTDGTRSFVLIEKLT